MQRNRSKVSGCKTSLQIYVQQSFAVNFYLEESQDEVI